MEGCKTRKSAEILLRDVQVESIRPFLLILQKFSLSNLKELKVRVVAL
jgi:hypothetical protein